MFAITLSRKNYREYDQLISVYAKEAGKLELLAKGAKKSTSKNAAYLEPFFVVDLEWVQGKDLARLTKVVPEKCFVHIQDNLTALELLQYSLKVFDQALGVGEKDEKVFTLLVQWLTYLDNARTFQSHIVDSLLLKLWVLLGYRPVLSACVLCGEKNKAAFYARGGGAVCAADRAKLSERGEVCVELSQSDWQSLEGALEASFENVGNISDQLHHLVGNFLNEHSAKAVPNFAQK